MLIVTILNLIYRLPERAAEHHRAIQSLTAFIRDTEDMVELDRANLSALTIIDLEKVRERYKGMVASLPPSTDKEFIRSKKDYAEKRQASAAINAGGEVLGPSSQVQSARGSTNDAFGCLQVILLSAPERIALLRAVRNVDSQLWITGGFVRNAVWDVLHGYTVYTPLDDVDVIYFEERKDDKHHEVMLNALRGAAPNINWSLKNQAAMKDAWLPTAPSSLDEALRRFTDTATAVAVRLVDDSRIEVRAPYGLDDLFSLVVRPTPSLDPATYRRRLEKKAWDKTWPNLSFEDATS